MVLSLVFSTGGVAIIGRADSTAVSKPADPKQLPPAKALPDQCTGTPRSPRVLGARPRVKRDTKPETVVLNSQGYNYANMGESHPAPAVSEPPAAPAKTDSK
ncbi:MAG: hypothetical protein ACRDMZ_01400 [Solirubrobacteraceae bacterium]